MTNELRARYEKINLDYSAEVKEANDKKDKALKEVRELMDEADKIRHKANLMYVQTKLEHMREVNAAEIKRQKAIDELNIENRGTRAVRTGNPLFDLLVDVLNAADYDTDTENKKEDNHTCSCESGECSCESGECSCKKEETAEHELTVEEKIKFIDENFHKLNEHDIYRLGLIDARIIKVRNNHICEKCGEEIKAQMPALVAYKLVTPSGIEFNTAWENDEDLVQNNIGVFLRTNSKDIKFNKVRYWLHIDCVYNMIKNQLDCR